MQKYEEYMKICLTEANLALSENNPPFGCCIISKDNFVSAHNTSLSSKMPVSHAEINAIFQWLKQYGHHTLRDATIYSTAEPCMMCLGAIGWCKIRKIVFGVSLDSLREMGFDEFQINLDTIRTKFPYKVEVVAGVMEKECVELFEKWRHRQKILNAFIRKAE